MFGLKKKVTGLKKSVTLCGMIFGRRSCMFLKTCPLPPASHSSIQIIFAFLVETTGERSPRIQVTTYTRQISTTGFVLTRNMPTFFRQFFSRSGIKLFIFIFIFLQFFFIFAYIQISSNVSYDIFKLCMKIKKKIFLRLMNYS